jgi:hypothetical protein
MHPIFEKYFDLLMQMFQYDISVMSQPWMYYFVVPIIGYLVFFFIKWAVLTAPFWLPFSIIIGAAKARPNLKKKVKE